MCYKKLSVSLPHLPHEGGGDGDEHDERDAEDHDAADPVAHVDAAIVNECLVNVGYDERNVAEDVQTEEHQHGFLFRPLPTALHGAVVEGCLVALCCQQKGSYAEQSGGDSYISVTIVRRSEND